MRFWAVLLAGATLAGTGMAAQAATAEEPKAVRAAPGEPSSRQLTLSRRYVELMQGDQLESVLRAVIEEGARSDGSTDDMAQEDRDFVINLATELTTEMMPEMMDQLVPVYARTFSEAELEALIAFYDTELGRSVISKTWTSMPETNEAMMSVMPAMMEKMGARICAHYGCDPSEVEALTGASAPQARTK